MQTLQQFVNERNGRYVDYDKYYGYQCVDLVQFWSQNLGGPRFRGNAADIINQAGSFYTRVNSGTPLPGDIVVFKRNSSNGNAGHIAISLDGLTTFDQNYPTGSPCRVSRHTQSEVLGWLHPKTNPGGSLPYSEKQYTDAKAGAINYLYLLYHDRGAKESDVRAHLGADLVTLENQLRNPDDPASEEHRNCVKKLFAEYFGPNRAVSDAEIRQRTGQNNIDIRKDFEKSEEHANYK